MYTNHEGKLSEGTFFLQIIKNYQQYFIVIYKSAIKKRNYLHSSSRISLIILQINHWRGIDGL